MDKKTLEMETKLKDDKICFATVRKSKDHSALTLFIYDEDLDKLCTTGTYQKENPKYLNLNPGTDGKKYVYMDREVHFLNKIIDDFYPMSEAIDHIKSLMPENVFQIFFQNVIVPSLGRGVSLSELNKANNQIVKLQSKNKTHEDELTQ